MDGVTDLPGQILAAIEETEQIAQAATPGPWFAPGPDDIAEWSIFGDGWVIASAQYYPRTDMASAFPKLRKPATVIEHANRNAAHIAHNDPAIVLRMCAAHRCVIARHQADEVGLCKGCHYKNQHGDCPELNDLAAAYGIVADERTGQP